MILDFGFGIYGRVVAGESAGGWGRGGSGESADRFTIWDFRFTSHWFVSYGEPVTSLNETSLDT